MKYPKLRELREAVRSLISKPYTTKFPHSAHIPFPKFRGKPQPDDKECIACGACALVCPSRAIEIKDNLNQEFPAREVIWHYDLCVFCGQCERLCTTKKGVKLSLEYDLAATDRTTLFSKVEKEFLLCEDCGSVVAPKAQLVWLLKKLGPIASGNFNIIYTSQNNLEISEDLSSGLTSKELQRTDLYRILCPKCRHLVLVFNQTGEQP